MRLFGFLCLGFGWWVLGAFVLWVVHYCEGYFWMVDLSSQGPGGHRRREGKTGGRRVRKD